MPDLLKNVTKNDSTFSFDDFCKTSTMKNIKPFKISFETHFGPSFGTSF